MASRVIRLVVACLVWVPSAVLAQEPVRAKAMPGLDDLLAELAVCADSAGDPARCDGFVGRALLRAYCVDDFVAGADGLPRWLANDIAVWVASSDDWEELGAADDQHALIRAQAAANTRIATLAVRQGDPDGHVAVILPGGLSASSTWDLVVPNAASFFADRPDSSFAGKGLSLAFDTPEGVRLYARAYTPCVSPIGR